MTEQTEIMIRISEPYKQMHTEIVQIHGEDAVESEIESLIHQLYQKTQTKSKG